MPPKRKGATARDKIEAAPAKTAKGKEEDKNKKTPTISPDKGATGETATSSKTMEAGTQTGWLQLIDYKCMKKGSSQQQ